MNKFQLLIGIFVLLLKLGFAFQIVDEGSIIKVSPGDGIVKNITILNLSEHNEVVNISWYLKEWPDKDCPAYKVELIRDPEDKERIVLRPNTTSIYPVKIKANKYLAKGNYVYWFSFSQITAKKQEETYKMLVRDTYNLPVVIEIQ